MRIGKILVVIVALMLISIGATAQDSRDPWISNDVARVNIMANLPWASVGLHFGMAAILGCDGDLSLGDYMTMTSILELSAAPLYTYDPTDAWYGSFATSTLLAAEGYAADRFGTDSFAAGYLHWTRVSLAEYRAYEAYARTRLDSHSYSNSGFTRHRLVDLYRAPINPAVLRDPLVLGYAAGDALLVLASQAILSGGFPQAVWQTGRAYVGEEEVSFGRYALANLLASTYYFSGAVGEECYYRGYLFEEIRHHAGFGVAAAVDCTFFTLQHVITDIIRGEDPWFIVIHAVQVALSTIAADHLYVRGGLEATVASHAWTNTLVRALVAPGFGGVPASERFVQWGL